jgi:hypothetical protein
VWRSAGKHVHLGGQAVWAGLARVVIALAAVGLGYNTLHESLPILAESGRLMRGIDNTPAAQFRVLRDGTELEVAGGLPFGTGKTFIDMLDKHPGIKVIHLNSQGGRIHEGIVMRDAIRQRHLTTYTSTACMSACTIAYLGGTERLLAKEARLGFHSGSVGTLSGSDAQELNGTMRQVMHDAGLPADFINHALNTAASDIWLPKADELLSAGVITRVVSSYDFGISGMGSGDMSDASLEREVRKIALYDNLARYDRTDFDRLFRVLADSIRAGKSVSDVQAQGTTMLYDTILPRFLKVAPQDAYLGYWHAHVAQLRDLLDASPETCTALEFPERPARSPALRQEWLSKATRQQQLDAVAEVIKQASLAPTAWDDSHPDAKDAVIKATMALRSADPQAFAVISQPAGYAGQSRKLCESAIALYDQLFALPPQRAAAGMHYLMARVQHSNDSAQ